MLLYILCFGFFDGGEVDIFFSCIKCFLLFWRSFYGVGVNMFCLGVGEDRGRNWFCVDGGSVFMFWCVFFSWWEDFNDW